MKIFISYGHADHTQLVDRLFDALLAAGHAPWKDDRYEGRSGIAPGKDFTKVIYEAIDDADFVVAFVTRITKEKAYCCDERQYAYNKKGSRFIQLRLDRVEITLGNSRSYIDLSNVEDTTGSINEKLFENACNGLFAAFRDPESFAEGGITPWTKINTHLRVPGALRYEEFITMPAADDFVGRRWLVEQVRAWAQDSTIAKRLFVIQGEAGTGKTAFVRHLAQDQELVRSVHVCVYDKPSTRTLRDTLKDLAYVLACKGGAYYEFLKAENLEKIRDMAEDALFEYLFLEPLKLVQEKYLLIIDGLDELEESSGLRPLIRLFRQYAHRINPNISFLVTTRPDAYITEQLRTVGGSRPLESVALDREASREDLSCYIRQKLEEMDCYSERLAAKILEVCDGNFEYLSLLFREAKEDGVPVTEDTPMPRGLNERYVQYLDRRMETEGQTKLTKEQHRLLSLLSVCREAIPLSLLAEAVELDEYDAQEALEIFGSLLRQTEADGELLIALFTKSFRDFLVGKSCRRYSANEQLGQALLCRYILENCPREKNLDAVPYLCRNGVLHLLEHAVREPEEVTAYLQSLSAAGCNIARRLAEALAADAAATMVGYMAICEKLGVKNTVLSQLRSTRSQAAAEAMAAQFRAAGWQRDALRLEAELLLWDPTPKKKEMAQQLYQQLLEQDSRAYEAAPDNETRGDLADSYMLSASFYSRQKTAQSRAKAMELFGQMQRLAEENYQEKPDWKNRRLLMCAYSGLASLEKAEEAEYWRRKILVLAQQNYQEKPDFETRWDLDVAYSQLAIALQQTGQRLEEAEQLTREALALAEKNYQENPCFETRDGLGAVYDLLGNIAKKRATREGREEAARWFAKEKELVEQNFRENPCYRSRREMAIVYERLGDLARDMRTKAGDAEAEILYRQRMELVEQIYRENPCYQSRRSLLLVYSRFRTLAERKETSESLLEAKKWNGEQTRLAEQNYQENPCAQSLRDLADAYERKGVLTDKLRMPAWQEEAKAWFGKGLELLRQDYQENPSQTSRTFLAALCGRRGLLAVRARGENYIDEALRWYTESLALHEENLADAPTAQNYRKVAELCAELAELVMKKQPAGDQAAAETWLLKAKAVWEENYRKNPSEESCRLLGDSYSRLGDLMRKIRTREGIQAADGWYQKKLALDEENYQKHPNSRTRRALALICDKIGMLHCSGIRPVLERRNLEWFLRAARLLQENYEADPNDSARKDLLVAYERMGTFEKNLHTRESAAEAEKWYRKKLELLEEMYHQSPNEANQERLVRCYDQLADLALKQQAAGDYAAAAAAAEVWYQKALALVEKSYGQQPTFSTRRWLAVCYERMGDLARDRRTEEGNEEAERWYLKKLPLCEENYKVKPDCDTRRSLAFTCDRLGVIRQRKQTAEAQASAEALYRRALQLAELNAQEDPERKSDRILEMSYYRLARIQDHKNTPEARSEAKYFYEKEAQQLESRCDERISKMDASGLAIVYKRLGELEQALQPIEGVEAAKGWYKKAVESIERLPKEQQDQSCRQLAADACQLLVAIFAREDTPEGREAADYWQQKQSQFLSAAQPPAE